MFASRSALAVSERDDFLSRAGNGDAAVSRGIAVRVAGRARGAGFGQAPARGKNARAPCAQSSKA